MNLNSDDYYSRNSCLIEQFIESDGEKRKGIRSPTPKIQSNDHTFIGNDNDQTDQYVEELKKGTSNILVSLFVV